MSEKSDVVVTGIGVLSSHHEKDDRDAMAKTTRKILAYLSRLSSAAVMRNSKQRV